MARTARGMAAGSAPSGNMPSSISGAASAMLRPVSSGARRTFRKASAKAGSRPPKAGVVA
jgi:hypothetical protein